MRRERKSLIFISVIVLLSALSGFVHWWLVGVVAFMSGLLLKRMTNMSHPVLIATLAVALGWIIVALERDFFESGRVSAKLATFLGLSHAIVMYLALFVICALPSFFAALSGSLLVNNPQADNRAD